MASAQATENLTVSKEDDLVLVRNRARYHARQIGLGLVDETKFVTAVSELARNMLTYAGAGQALIEQLTSGDLKGVKMTFEDHGPGIADLNLALTDGYSTTKSLGLGLPGARRLVDDFQIRSSLGEGTLVSIITWKR